MRVNACAVCLLLSMATAQAQNSDEDTPGLEFLEFLGEWETDDGRAVDPLSLLEDDEPQASVSGRGK